ncbi:MAG: radical SAM protein [Pseudomonadota bacterium]
MAARTDAYARPRDYFILVPTLRCNLRCDYCQVSRAAENARGFDWDTELLTHIRALILATEAREITLEFQGGEPLLRLDVMINLRDAVRRAGKRVRTVVCTNLQRVDAAAWAFFGEEDVFISTSFDGTWDAHDTHRTRATEALSAFRANLERALSDFGTDRVSLTTTLDPRTAPAPETIFAAFDAMGVRTMFLRPVNHQGFARKAYDVREDNTWDSYYLDLLDRLIAYNLGRQNALSEHYFAYVLRRILDPRRGEHVDLRNPSPVGSDYLVVGERGDLFPTDEARMLFRTGQIDLRIGHVTAGLDPTRVAQLNRHADNRADPDCARCVYQAVCGRDLVDDLSRYGRIDGPRQATRHCRRHLALFDHILRRLSTATEPELDVMAAMAGLSGLDTTPYRPAHA